MLAVASFTVETRWRRKREAVAVRRRLEDLDRVGETIGAGNFIAASQVELTVFPQGLAATAGADEFLDHLLRRDGGRLQER